ncbi:hypothetical protein MESS2_980037 [Mesorhizobium metallidurans STM 2683]|uniref:Transposase n=1 Tax=Mesorhizobium metallidurans STM 2683 TaxID=1297569 RepID=M5EZF7_9HYPH|nr:hypothetical protein MESS2_980037 [Mesorhizobium metallidurans STM 2683]
MTAISAHWLAEHVFPEVKGLVQKQLHRKWHAACYSCLERIEPRRKRLPHHGWHAKL